MPHDNSRCPTCGRKRKRSNPANARYWALLAKIAAVVYHKGKLYPPESWHEDFKRALLGCDDVALPSGEVLTIPRSTADLTTDEFSDYMAKVEAWALDEHGVWLEE